MRFSIIFSVLAGGTVAFAGAVRETDMKRPVADVTTALISLSGSCGIILAEFEASWNNDCDVELSEELAGSIDDCNTALQQLFGGPADNEVADHADGLVNKIVQGLEEHRNKCGDNHPNNNSNYSMVGSSLSILLKTASDLSPGLSLPLAARDSDSSVGSEDANYSSWNPNRPP